MDLPTLVQLFQGSALLAVVIAFLQEWIVPGTRYRRDLEERQKRIQQLRQERQVWQQMAIHLLDTTDKTATIAERLSATNKVA